MRKVLVHIDRHLEETIACACLATVACLVFLQVVLRYGFDRALIWSEELAGFAMVWAVYMGAALAVRERFHVRIMAGVVALPGKLPLRLVVLADLIWLGFNLFMIRVCVEYLGVLWNRPSISPSLGIDMFWPETIVLIGHLLMSFRLMQIYWRWHLHGRSELPGVSAEYQTPASAAGE